MAGFLWTRDKKIVFLYCVKYTLVCIFYHVLFYIYVCLHHLCLFTDVNKAVFKLLLKPILVLTVDAFFSCTALELLVLNSRCRLIDLLCGQTPANYKLLKHIWFYICLFAGELILFLPVYCTIRLVFIVKLVVV